jgi:hypothetical protein
MTRIFPLSLIFCVLDVALSAPVNVTEFGAKGDGVTDDTSAIRRALADSAEVHFPAGVYVVTDGIDLPPSAILTGAGSPVLGTFPMREDDKRFLRDALTTNLPGTTLLFKGAGKRGADTGRRDGFARVRYAVKTGTALPYQIRGLAICMDMQTTDARNRPTHPKNDERADYDVGLLIDDSPGGSLRDVRIFGYWKKAGLCLISRGAGSNPDYNTFWNCSFSGEYGVALLGADQEVGPGLSGTQFYGCNLFSNDHHSRRGGQWGSGALFIDGRTMGKRADLNGHYFFGGCVRTYSNVAVRLDHASNVGFHGVVFEVPEWEGKDGEGADRTGRIIGTAATRDVLFVACRMQNLGLGELARNMTFGSVTVIGGAQSGIWVQSGEAAARLHNSANGDPLVQLARNLDSVNNGWTLRLDASEQENLVLRHNNRRALTLSPDGTLSTGVLTTRSLRVGKTEKRKVVAGQATIAGVRTSLSTPEEAELITLNGGVEGEIAILEFHTGSAHLSVPASTNGNLRLSQPFMFNHPTDRLMLLHDGEVWTELSRTKHPGS